MRIAVGGIGHETNTFSTLRTRLDDFTIRRGNECVQGELWDRLRTEAVELAPTLIAGATPNGLVDHMTYQTLKAELLQRLEAALPVDGVYLSLHGAMEVEHLGDGETDLASAVRNVVGPEVPIAASLDLHGNLSPEFVASVDILTALRTAPHVDGPETRDRTLRHLLRTIREGRRPITAMAKLPLILPGEHAVTDIEPARSLYGMLPDLETRPGIWDASLMIGCAWTDSPYTSVSALVVADEELLAKATATELSDAVWLRRREFGPEVETVGVDEAIAWAITLRQGPAFISDSGDNVTAGGAGDVPLFIERLLAAQVPDALVAGLADSEAVDSCLAAGVGSQVSICLGGKLDKVNGQPLAVKGTVLRAEPTLAALQVEGVTILLTAGRRPFHMLAAFEPYGIDPLARKVVVVKQGYLAPELRAKCAGTVLALSPGFTDQRIASLPYQRIRRPIYPLDNVSLFPRSPAG